MQVPQAPVEVETDSVSTIEQVREALAKLIDAGKRDVALQILKENGAAKVGELTSDKFSFVVQSAEKALA